MIIEFAFFLLKALTITLLIFIPIFFIASSLKGKSEATDTLRIKNLSKKYMSMADSLKVLSLNKEETKKFVKASKKNQKSPQSKHLRLKKSQFM